MEELLESSSTDTKTQDKKNYATESANENVISANNSNGNSTTIANEKQSRIAELVNFFNQLYGKKTVS